MVYCCGAQCSDCFPCPLEAVGAVMRALDNLWADGLLGKPAGFRLPRVRTGTPLYDGAAVFGGVASGGFLLQRLTHSLLFPLFGGRTRTAEAYQEQT